MKIYATIDEFGLDGFGTKTEDRIFRQIRAAANHWRGMRYLELVVTKKEYAKLIEYCDKGQHKKAALLLIKKKGGIK